MIQFRSAREAWAQAYYERWDSISHMMAQSAELGVVEAGGFIKRKVTELDEEGNEFSWTQHVYCPAAKQDRGGRTNSAGKAADQAMAGYIQRAISNLSPGIRAFGHHMYSALASTDDREAAEALVWEWFELRRQYQGMRMTATKRERAYYIAKLCLHRYRRIHQGGMSAGIDPTPDPESFRQALDDVYGVHLQSAAWGRDWQPTVDMLMAICSDIDKVALVPVAAALSEMKEVA